MITNDETEWMLEESVVEYFKVPSRRHLCGELDSEKNNFILRKIVYYIISRSIILHQRDRELKWNGKISIFVDASDLLHVFMNSWFT
jgi:hypothetical protein